MDSKFIVECHSEHYFNGNTFYLRKIGPKQYNIEFTDDPYKAKVLDKKQTADKTCERIHKYMNYCYNAGYSTYSYWDNDKKISIPIKDIETKVRNIKLSFID